MSITLGVGGTGCLVNRYFYDQIAEEHGVNAGDGSTVEGTHAMGEERRSLYFSETTKSGYRPRTVFIDLDESGLHRALGSQDSNPSSFYGKAAHYGSCSGGSLYSEASKEAHQPVLVSAIDSIRREIEACDSFKGVRVFASAGGGTGSGVTKWLLDNGDLSLASKAYIFSVFPDSSSLAPPEEWTSTLNSLQLANYAASNARGVLWYDWSAVERMTKNNDIEALCPLDIPFYQIKTRGGTTSNLSNFAEFETEVMDLLQPGLAQLLEFNEQRAALEAAVNQAKNEAMQAVLADEANNSDEGSEYESGMETDDDNYDSLESKIENHPNVIKAMEEARERNTPKLVDADHVWDPFAKLKLITSDYKAAIASPVNWLGRYLREKQVQSSPADQKLVAAETQSNIARFIALSAASVTAIERMRCSRFSSLDVLRNTQPVAKYNFFVPGLHTVEPVPEGLDGLIMNKKTLLADIDPIEGKYASVVALYRGTHLSFKDSNESLRQSFGCNVSKESFMKWASGPTRSELCNAPLPRGTGIISTVAITSALDARFDSLCKTFTKNIEKGFQYRIPAGSSFTKHDAARLTESMAMNQLKSLC